VARVLWLTVYNKTWKQLSKSKIVLHLSIISLFIDIKHNINWTGTVRNGWWNVRAGFTEEVEYPDPVLIYTVYQKCEHNTICGQRAGWQKLAKIRLRSLDKRLLLAQYFILNSRLGSSAKPFLHRPFPYLPDWFHGLSDHLKILLCSTAGSVCTVC